MRSMLLVVQVGLILLCAYLALDAYEPFADARFSGWRMHKLVAMEAIVIDWDKLHDVVPNVPFEFNSDVGEWIAAHHMLMQFCLAVGGMCLLLMQLIRTMIKIRVMESS